MTDFFFKDNKCGIANKVPKSDFKFVLDCDIATTPPPIFDCPVPIVPRDVEIPCPKFDVKSKLQVGYTGDVKNCPVKGSEIEFKIEKKKFEGCPAPTDCEYDVSLIVDIAVPAPPCPEMTVGTFNVKSGYADQPCVEDESRFEIRKRRVPGQNCDDPGSCEFEFDVSIVVPIPRPPCPEINVKTFTVTSDYAEDCSPGQNRFEITTTHRPPESCADPGECKFDVELEIYVPLPRPPCPEIKVTSFAVSTLYPQAQIDCGGGACENKFEIRRVFEPAPCTDPRRPPKCDFEVDLAICIPPPLIPCPEINVTTFEVKTGYKDSPCLPPGPSTFKVTKREIPGDCATPPKCEFDFDVSIVVPIPVPPCPVINVKTFTVTSDYAKDCAPGQNRFEITTTRRPPESCDDPGECKFDVELEIYVPIPRPPCPEIRVTSFAVSALYPIAQSECGDPDNPPENKFEIRRVFEPAPCTDPTQTPKCDFEVDLAIYIPPPLIPCPEINIKTFEVKTGYKDSPCLPPGPSTFKVTKREIPGDCATPPKCEFDFDITLVIPLPPIVCPEIAVKTFVVKSDYADQCAAGNNIFKITPKHKPAQNCVDSAPECNFEVELEIYVPIPRPPCPVINVKTFNVTTTNSFDDCPPGKNRFEITRRAKNAPCGGDGTVQDECEFDVELEINIPPPLIPCPDIKIKNFEVKTVYKLEDCASSPSKFEITKKTTPSTCTEPEKCEFEIELTIEIPIPEPLCPDIKIKKFELKTHYKDAACPNGGDSSFTITKTKKLPACDPNSATTEPPQCEFEIELTLDVPIPVPPCPDIKVKTFTVKSDYQKCLTGRGSSLKITKTTTPPTCEDQQPKCEFEIELEIEVPIPEPPCPDIKVKSFDVNYFEYNPLTGPPAITSNCNFLKITKTTTPPDCLGSGDTPGPTGATGPTNCEFNIDLQLCIPTPRVPCPTFNTKFKVESKYENCISGSNVFEIKRNLNNPDNCEFDVNLELAIPIPKPPCPEFNTKLLFTTFLGVPGCGVGGGIFDVVKDVIPGSCEGEPEKCLYTFTLELYVPIPKFVEDVVINAPNPKINVNWCQPGVAALSKVNFKFVRNADLWALRCDHGQRVEFDSTLDIDIVLPRPPCDFFVLKPKQAQFPIKRVANNDEFFKLKILPKPGLGCNPCEFEFDIDLQLQCVPCPVFHKKAFNVYFLSGTADPPRGDIKITNRPKPDCEFPCEYDIDVEIYIPKPCTPKFKLMPVNYNPCYYSDYASFLTCQPDPDEWLRVEIIESATADCEYEIYLYAKPPVYEPPEHKCDEFYNSYGIKVQYTTAELPPPGRIKITPRPLSPTDTNCVYDIEADIYIPTPCTPKFKLMPVNYNPCYYSDKATFLTCQPDPDEWLRVEIIESATADCEYEIHIYAKPPVYEPAVNCDEFIVSSGFKVIPTSAPYPAALPASTLKIEPRPLNDSDNHCTYDVTADIYVPAQTKVVIRNKSIGWSSISRCSNDDNPSLELTITEPDENGIQYLDCDIKIPRWPEYTPGNWYVKDSDGNEIGTAELTIDPADSCYRYIGGSINLTTTTCSSTSSAPMPMTMPFSAVSPNAATAAASIIDPWGDETFVAGFIAALKTNKKLKTAVKALLTEE